ncbi:hypothetical protein AgCh_034691 [Apium graveolens]
MLIGGRILLGCGVGFANQGFKHLTSLMELDLTDNNISSLPPELCDCGGWDMGCALTILKTQQTEALHQAKTFDMFAEGSNVLNINWLAYSGVPLTMTLTLFCSNTGLQKNDKRERVVKASRDITINSKKVVFQVHRYVTVWQILSVHMRWNHLGQMLDSSCNATSKGLVTVVDSGRKALEGLELHEDDEQISPNKAFTSPINQQEMAVNLIITDYCMPEI